MDDFSVNDLDSVALIRTDNLLNRIDTIQIGQSLNNDDYSISFYTIGNFGQQDFEFKDFSYLLLNNSLNQIDTLTDINYDIEIISKICNRCSGGIRCQDQYYDYKSYSEPEFKLNGNKSIGFEIMISKQ